MEILDIKNRTKDTMELITEKIVETIIDVNGEEVKIYAELEHELTLDLTKCNPGYPSFAVEIKDLTIKYLEIDKEEYEKQVVNWLVKNYSTINPMFVPYVELEVEEEEYVL